MGVDATGLTIPTVEETLADIEAEQRDTIDPTIVTEPEEPIGQINGIIVARLREVYELAQVAYNAFNPDAVEGQLQDNLGAITGTFRLRARATEVECTLDLDATTTIPAGAVVNPVGHPEIRFSLMADVTSTIADTYPGRFKCDELGPVFINAGTLTVIATPITGWNSVTNAVDSDTAPNTAGRDEETPDAFRIRREEELFRPGSASPDGLASDLTALDGVEQVTILENLTLTTDANGIPPLSFEAVIFDGLTPAVDDDVIAQAIFDSRAGGVRTYGSASGTAVDLKGDEHTMRFSRPTVLDLYLEYDLTVDDDYPGDVTFKETIVTDGQPFLNTSDDVIAERLKAIALSVAGVVDVLELRLGFSASPTGTVNLAVGVREIADLDTSRIVVAIP